MIRSSSITPIIRKLSGSTTTVTCNSVSNCKGVMMIPLRRQFSTRTADKSDSGGSTATTHFGFENVAVGEKEGRVKKVFNSVAESYDVMNDVMSAGIHRYWKDYFVEQTCVQSIARAVRMAHAKSGSSTFTEQQTEGEPLPELRILDVAGGTGDIAFRILKEAQCEERTKSSGQDPISVTVCDINTEMLRVGEQRARNNSGSNRIFHNGSLLMDKTNALSFVEGNAQDLRPAFPDDNSFDLYTIAFGLRNVTDIDRALQEAYRVLKPGGRYMCLEFSLVPNPLLRSIYDTYSFHLIPTMGQLIANDKDSYQYLVESIRKFPSQQELAFKMETIAGFQNVKYTNLTGGIVAIHEGWKPIE